MAAVWSRDRFCLIGSTHDDYPAIFGIGPYNTSIVSATQQACVADRLDRGHFGSRKQEKAFPTYHCDPFQPAANTQAVGRLKPALTDRGHSLSILVAGPK
jgi:hypothetical protein